MIKRIGPYSTSDREQKDLLKAWVAISFAFAILMKGLSFNAAFAKALILAAFTVGLGFLLHELAHKVVAQRYGCFAEFRSFDKFLILAIVMSFFGFLIAAPGAVMIKGPVGRRRNGMISIAGPATNITLALIFLAGSFWFGPSLLFQYGYTINVWLALFNAIPFGFLDGKKIFDWDRKIWGTLLAVSIVMLFSGSYFFV
jgi:Zn-dependent protease